MALQADLPDRASIEQLRIAGTVRRVASGASLGLKRGMLECERALFIAMTLDAIGITADGQFNLFCFKTAVWIVTIAAFHRAFQDLMVKRLAELRFGFRMAAHTKLRFAGFQSKRRGLIRIFPRHVVNIGDRACLFVTEWCGMRAVTICTADVITPVLASAIVIVAFFAGVTGKTCLRNKLRVLALERNYIFRVCGVFEMFLSRAVARFAALNLVLPTRYVLEFGMFSAGKILELVLVARLAGIAADVIVGACGRNERGLDVFMIYGIAENF